MGAVVVEISAGGLTEIYAPYDPEFVADVKDAIPPAFRRWDKPTRCWSVRSPFTDLALRVVRAHYGRVEVHDHRPPRRIPTSAPAGDDVFTALRTILGEALWPLAFGALARVVHPDVGGDNGLMRALNTANEGAPSRSSKRRRSA